jgi:uncharacterized Tic20 family protein
MKNTIGKWAALFSLISILMWFISFGMIAAGGPLFYWSSAEAYYEFVGNHTQFWQNLAKAFMLVFSIGFFVMHFALYEIRRTERSLAGGLGLTFLAMFALLSSLHYFVQVSSVLLSIRQGSTAGLEHFLQANPASFSLAVNMLGWTIMLGLGSFFIALMFESTGREKWFRIFHFINSFFCLTGLIGFLFQIDALTFLSMNAGVGGCITVLSVLGLLYFRKTAK